MYIHTHTLLYSFHSLNSLFQVTCFSHIVYVKPHRYALQSTASF